MKSEHDVVLKHILMRYAMVGVSLETYDGVPVDAGTRTLDGHHALIRRTPEIFSVYEAVSSSPK